MRILTRLLALARYLTLARQARELRRMLDALPRSAQRALATMAMAEIEKASGAPQPRYYADTDSDPYQPWGTAAGEAFLRARSPVPQLKLKGIAVWLAVVFHETRDSPHPLLQGMHREVLGFLGLLKGTYELHARAGATRAAA